MEEVNSSELSPRELADSDCGANAEGSRQVQEEPVNQDISASANTEPGNQNQFGNKRNRVLRRRQRNQVQRIPGVPLKPLFPNRQNPAQLFDLRDMLARSSMDDATAWWHSTYNDAGGPPGPPPKKSRSNGNPFDIEKDQPPPVRHFDKLAESKEDVINPRKYVIVIEDYPKTLLTEEQAHEIQSILTNELVSFNEPGDAPKFWSCYLKQGALVISCTDDKSKDWLIENVPSVALDGDVKLKIGEAKNILLTTKVTIFIPKIFKNIDQDNILKLLKTQNSGIKTDLWNILECKDDEKGRSFSIAIDEDSFVSIKIANYKIHLGLSLVKVNDPQFFRLSSLNTTLVQP